MNETDFPETDIYSGLNHQDKPTDPVGKWPERLDLRRLARIDPPPPDFIIDNWLPARYATLLAGHGGAGKSSIALQQAVCIALGLPWCGFATKQRKILYMSCEDGEEVIHWRLCRICQNLNIDMEDLHDKLNIIDLVGTDVVLYQANTQQTGPFQQLTIELKDSEVIYVDGISDVYSGDENNRAMVKQFINLMLSIIPKTGAVVLIGHVNKVTAISNGTTQGYSGSTGWHNSVRARWYLHQESNNEGEPTGGLMLELQKSNLGKCDQKVKFEYNEADKLFVGEFVPGSNSYQGKQKEERLQVAILDVLSKVENTRISNPMMYVPASLFSGKGSAWNIMTSHPDWPDEFKGDSFKNPFAFWVNRMQHEGKISNEIIQGKRRGGYVTILTCA